MIRVIARPLCWLGWVVVLTTFSVDLYSQESMEQKKEAKRSIVDFARDIEPLFASRCNECHRGTDGKGGFDVTDKDVVLGYVTAGSAEKSPLWTDYLMADPSVADSMVMPLQPKGGLRRRNSHCCALGLRKGPNGMHPPSTFVGQRGSGREAGIHSTGMAVSRLLSSRGGSFPDRVDFDRSSQLDLFFLCRQASRGFCKVLPRHRCGVRDRRSDNGLVVRQQPRLSLLDSSLASQQDATFFWHRWLGLSVAILAWITALFAIASGKIPK